MPKCQPEEPVGALTSLRGRGYRGVLAGRKQVSRESIRGVGAYDNLTASS